MRKFPEHQRKTERVWHVQRAESELSESAATATGFARQDFVWLAASVALAAATRLFNLNLLGPFCDEGGHILMAVDYDYLPLWQRVRLGKVLGYTLFYPTAHWAADPLYSTRLLVASLGILTTVAIFLIAQELYGRPAGVLAGCFWALCPYVVFHDRLALHDPLVSTFTAFSLLLALKAAATRRCLVAALSGLLLGAATGVKVIAAVHVFWILGPSIMYLHSRRSGLQEYVRLGVSATVGALIPILAIVIFMLPSMGSYLKNPLEYGGVFLGLGNNELSRMELFATNWQKVWEWVVCYNSWQFPILVGIAILLSIILRLAIALPLSCAITATISVFCVIFSFWVPRYLLPVLIPTVVYTAGALGSWVQQDCARRDRKARQGLGLVLAGFRGVTGTLALVLSIWVFGTWVKTDWTLQTRPFDVNIPGIDQYQYFDGWPSGTGVRETAGFLRQFAATNGGHPLVLVGMGGTQGWSGLRVLLMRDRELEVQGLHVVQPEDLRWVFAAAIERSVLVVLEPPREFLPPGAFEQISPAPTLLFEHKRPRADGGFSVYAIAPNSRLREGA